MFLEAERWEMNSGTKYAGLREYADAPNAINLHLHVRVAVWVSKVGKMRSPSGVFSITLHNDSILVQCLG